MGTDNFRAWVVQISNDLDIDMKNFTDDQVDTMVKWLYISYLEGYDSGLESAR